MNSSTESQFRADPAEDAPEIEDLFSPLGVKAAQMLAAGHPSDLYPQEAECVLRAVPKRVNEFAAGRVCARRALSRLGIKDFILLPAQDRAPVWPSGIVGSITHTGSFCAAAVAASAALSGIGIDTEHDDRVGEELWAKICVAEELRWIQSLPQAQRAAAAALVFSIKEAFYKCQYPLTREWLDFKDLRVEGSGFPERRGTFRVTPMRALAVQGLRRGAGSCGYRFHDGLVTAAVAFGALDR